MIKIGVVGTGTVAKSLIKGFISEGYDIKVGSREETSEDVIELKQTYPNIDIVSYEEAVRFGEVVIMPVPGAALQQVIEKIGKKEFEGKILWDITNALSKTKPVNGVIELITSPDESLAEKIQKILPDTQVVKALNTVGSALMYKPQLSEKGTAFLAGNSEEAKETIEYILSKFGWETYNTGKIESSRALEYMGQLYIAQGNLFNNWNMTFKFIK